MDKKKNDDNHIGDKKFYMLFKALSPREKKGFLDFLGTPFFNKKGIGVNLVEFLIEQNKQRNRHPPLISEILPYLITKKQGWKTSDLNRRFSDLTNLLKTFYAIISLKEQDRTKERLVMDTIQKKQKMEWLNVEVENALGKKTPLLEGNLYLHRHKLSFLKYFNPEYPKYHSYESIDPLLDSLRELDKFYCLQSLKLHCELMNRKNIMEEKEQRVVSYSFPSGLISQYEKDDELIRLYHSLYKLLNRTEEDSETHRELIAYLKHEEKPPINHNDMVIMANLVMNHYIFLGRKGAPRAYSTYYNYALSFVRGGVLFEKGGIRPDYFLNILIAGMEGGICNHELEEFISEYEKSIRKKDKELVDILGKKYMLFHKEKFKEVLRLAIGVGKGKKHRNFYIRDELLILRARYETMPKDAFGESEVKDEIKRFRRYLGDWEGGSCSIKEANTNFLNFLERLVEQKIGKVEMDLGVGVEDVMRIRSLVCRKWLMEKVEELCNNS